ncbi:LPXTG-motif cell wall anchor domain-containing protein/TQXA domain-containing protein [Amycolatopsis tolypomycina]|uniref:LPXTG-motif cell wall anchor domain-containing protein/TQXA domain-containing protein n=1 Tax=Amycolatopsis tolypomycina TaxID=208445 RepID=A0A1H5C3P6_9PSEU|nr:thioester domain-containing protein [Amycolatopsis tolypomycina]SED61266.1 LPXTG-motif cell wall anchor domain-containing protein/TQXA domain-containing protein [Amycolatopsis tolypomycina]
MQVRSALVRGGIAVLAAAAAVMVGAPAALADDGAARGRVIEEAGTVGYRINLEGGGDPIAKLFGFKLSDGKSLKLYCVEITVAMRTDVDMVETPWNKYPKAKAAFNDNSDKLNWVLHHGYPGLKLADVEAALAKQGIKVHDGISEREGIAATQAAVWHFSDNVNLDLKKPLAEPNPAENNADVAALYSYLIGDQNKGIGAQPKPTLNIAGPKTEGKAGTKIGPFDVATSGDITSLTTELPEGVKVTDKDGKELKTADVKDGSKLFLDVPAGTKPGKGSFALKVTGELATGRLFVAENYASQPAQSLIVADSEKTQVAAKASASWTEAGAPATTAPSTPGGAPSGGGDLANTGVDAAVPFAIGGLLLGGGALMLLVNRRRSRA